MNSNVARPLVVAAMIGVLASVGGGPATRAEAELAQAPLADAASPVGTEDGQTRPPAPAARRRLPCGGPAIKPVILLICRSRAATAGAGSAHPYGGHVRLVVAKNPCLDLLTGSVS